MAKMGIVERRVRAKAGAQASQLPILVGARTSWLLRCPQRPHATGHASHTRHRAAHRCGVRQTFVKSSSHAPLLLSRRHEMAGP